MSRYLHIKGRKAVLELKPEITAFGRQIGIREAGAQLESLLADPFFGSKIPHLIISAGAEDRRFAVLLREYRVAGLPSGVLIPIDLTGELTVLAPREERCHASQDVMEYLLNRGAHVVMLSLNGIDFAAQTPERDLVARYATQTRRLRRSIPLKPTLDETFAQFGARTRRNLRHYARLASDELKAVFHSTSHMTEDELLDLNAHSSYPYPEWVMRWRYRLLKSPNGFCVTITINGSRYVSTLGGRRFEDHAIVDWVLNHTSLKRYSLSTVMRFFYLQHEIERGTKLLSFEGGTFHSMQHGFLEESVSDILGSRRQLSPRLLRRAIATAFPRGGNALANTLLLGRETWQ